LIWTCSVTALTVCPSGTLVAIDWAQMLRVTSQRTVGLLHKFLLAAVIVTVSPSTRLMTLLLTRTYLKVQRQIFMSFVLPHFAQSVKSWSLRLKWRCHKDIFLSAVSSWDVLKQYSSRQIPYRSTGLPTTSSHLRIQNVYRPQTTIWSAASGRGVYVARCEGLLDIGGTTILLLVGVGDISAITQALTWTGMWVAKECTVQMLSGQVVETRHSQRNVAHAQLSHSYLG
jgi:hypothetical protein